MNGKILDRSLGSELPEANRAGVGLSWSDRRLVVYCGCVVVLCLVCLRPLSAFARYAFDEELHSHILLIPFVAAYLVNLKRPDLASVGRGSALGSLSLGVSFAIAAVGFLVFPQWLWRDQLGQDDRMVFTGAGFALLLVACGFFILRSGMMGRLVFPFTLLVFMVPLPNAAVSGIEWFLMRASAEVAHWFFQWTGTPVFRSGQVMELPGTTLEVARNCSGVRSTLVLLITSLIACYMFLSSNVHRAILTAMVIPLGILRNGFRILVLGLLCVHVSPDMIDSWIHHQGGPLFFALSLVPLFAVAAWFRCREQRSEGPKPEPSAQPTGPASP